MIKKIFCTVFILFSFSRIQAQGHQHFSMPANIGKGYIEKTIIIKLKSGTHANITTNRTGILTVDEALRSIGAESIIKKFPHARVPETKLNTYGRKLADLTEIYEVKYAAPISMEKAINILLAVDKIEYAQPHYIPKPLYTPNDPQLSNQYHLALIRAYQAWNFTKGDTNVVIAITDNGTDLDHPDLAANVKHNYADPINGTDDDNDGYTDNFNGWDMGDNDNNPTVDPTAPTSSEPFHGSVVCGLAAGVTDNNTGIAGVGFNCKFLPVKLSDNTGDFVKAYEGVVYAADHGATIINCSWGDVVSGQFEQDIIDYAVNNKDILVVAAAGNGDYSSPRNYTTPFYPASLDGVLSVTATTSSDVKWAGSTYNEFVDIAAPGENVTSTEYNDSYTVNVVDGTSFAAPIVSGCAALLKSKFPSLNAIQLGEKLRVTADVIDTIPANSAYKGMLGRGRVNVYQAIIDNSTPSVRMISRVITDNNDSIFAGGDTLKIKGTFENYLEASTPALTATISSVSPYVTIVSATATLGTIVTFATKNNNSNPFLIKLAANTPTNSVIQFKITYTDGTYTDYQYFSITVSKDYVDMAVNAIGTTITSKGPIGYNAQYTDGLGFTYKSSLTLLSEMGLMIGIDSLNLSDCVRNDVSGPFNSDFKPLAAARKLNPSTVSDFDVLSSFDDSQALHPLNLKIRQESHAWVTAADSKYIIVEYILKNNSATNYTNLHAGLFADWDIISSTDNKAAVDTVNKMGYVYYTRSNPIYAGIKLLTTKKGFNNYAIDNTFGGSGGIDLSDGFSKSDKFKTLSISRDSAGKDSLFGNDVAHVVSAGPFAINAGDSARIAFALIAGDSLADIIRSAKAADAKYNPVLPVSVVERSKSFSLKQNYPNPFSESTVIGFAIPEAGHTVIEVYDMLGKQVISLDKGILNAGEHEVNLATGKLDNGIYYYKLTSGKYTASKKMVLNK